MKLQRSLGKTFKQIFSFVLLSAAVAIFWFPWDEFELQQILAERSEQAYLLMAHTKGFEVRSSLIKVKDALASTLMQGRNPISSFRPEIN